MGEPITDYEYERRFFCHELPEEYRTNNPPDLIVQSYYVHQDNYGLRVRLRAPNTEVEMTADTDPMKVLADNAERFTSAIVTIKGPSRLGQRYEHETEIDVRTAVELVKRGGEIIVKNRWPVWIHDLGWDVDVFGGNNAPLIIAEAERCQQVTNLTIPSFCVTEVTDEARFNNDGLAGKPYSQWADEFEQELAKNGPRFNQMFGHNTIQE